MMAEIAGWITIGLLTVIFVVFEVTWWRRP